MDRTQAEIKQRRLRVGSQELSVIRLESGQTAKAIAIFIIFKPYPGRGDKT